MNNKNFKNIFAPKSLTINKILTQITKEIINNTINLRTK